MDGCNCSVKKLPYMKELMAQADVRMYVCMYLFRHHKKKSIKITNKYKTKT